MKITKHANRYINQSMNFVCHFCGCEFTAENGEWSIISIYSDWASAQAAPLSCSIGFTAKCECPECGLECTTTAWK